MKSLNGVVVVAAWGALAAGGAVLAQEADCNVNGIPDATEIAQGLVDDCNGNGIPDVCEYAGVMLEAEQSGFGNGSPLVATFTNLEPSISDVRLTIAVRADLDSVGEFVQVKVGSSVVTTLWVTGGQACPSEPQSQTVTVPAGTFNAALTKGTVVISLEPSGVVSVKECPTSSASVAAEYMSDLGPEDCLGTGVWDGCDIAGDPSLDCDENGIPDPCDIALAPNLDCDANGVIDSCELADGTATDCDQNGRPDACDPDCDLDGIPDACAIASGSVADCNANGRPDSCEVSPGQYFDVDCDLDGIPDDCQIAANPSLDENSDRVLDACQYARGDFNLDLEVGPADLALLISFWGTPDPPVGDLNGDGIIDGQDLGSLLIKWGTYSPPWGVILEEQPDPAVIPDPEWRARIIATGLPWRVREFSTGIEMLLVPPGEFMMGCSPSLEYACQSDEFPVHSVHISTAFYLGRYEVTQSEWTLLTGSNPSNFDFYSDSNVRPVESVSWDMVHAFVQDIGLRLPTEAEWEYACRADTATAFSNDSNDDSILGMIAWFNDGTSGYGTNVVGQRLPNPLGFHDMHGNVWEWVADWYGSTYYSTGPSLDPQGPTSGTGRVFRGGGWTSLSGTCRSSTRNWFAPQITNFGLGFRAARTP